MPELKYVKLEGDDRWHSRRSIDETICEEYITERNLVESFDYIGSRTNLCLSCFPVLDYAHHLGIRDHD